MTNAVRPPQRAADLRPQRRCTFGCAALDSLLGGGGVACGSVTELVGESGAGKTQLCLQLALRAALPDSYGGPSSAASLYIHTEFPFPLRRLRLLSSKHPSFPSSSYALDHVLVRSAHSAEELLAVLDRLDPLLVRPPTPDRPIKLIIVDSIAAVFRSDFDNTPRELRRRSTLFFRIAGRLKEVAARFGVAVVVTNQVVDVVDGGGGRAAESGGGGVRVGNYRELWSSGRRVCPALGLSWANCVNTRIFLSRGEEEGEAADPRADGVVEGGGGGERAARRRMQVVLAPHLPEASCEFVIEKEGVFGVRLGLSWGIM